MNVSRTNIVNERQYKQHPRAPRADQVSTTVVKPGFFRTELLTDQSTNYAEPSIKDYGGYAQGRWSSIGNPRTGGNPETRRSLRVR